MELIVVISILAVITGVVVASFAGGLRVLEAATGFNRVDAEVVPGMEILQKDLLNSFAFYGIDFKGDSSRVSFATLKRGGGSADNCRSISQVEYFIDRDSRELVRKIAAFPLGVRSLDAREESIIEGLETLEFSYFKPDPEIGGQWLESWGDPTNLPGAVKVRLGFRRSRQEYEFKWVRRVGMHTTGHGELKEE